MSFLDLSLNSIVLASRIPGVIQYKKNLGELASTQEKKLLGYVIKNANTLFGARHGFSKITNIKQYQDQVPLSRYPDYEEWISLIKHGRSSVLTDEPVTRLMPTSGSTSKGKLIPYTRSLQREFGYAISPWLLNFYYNNPSLCFGKAYWSITPHIPGNAEDEGNVPVSFADDSEYLGIWSQKLINKTMAVPDDLTKLQDFDLYLYTTVLSLLQCSNLRLISIWHPSFLSMLLNVLSEKWNQLLDDVQDESRRRYLKGLHPADIRRIWPKLLAVSCWGDGHSKEAINSLKNELPFLSFFEKGLLSTEGVVTFPMLLRQRGDEKGKKTRAVKLLSLNSHFYEFIAHDGKVLLAHEICNGEEYEVVLTTGGGFYRYCTGDRVRVTGFLKGVPCLSFIGKLDSVSDHFGEKLEDAFISNVLSNVLGRVENIRFSMMAPDDSCGTFSYTLYVEGDIVDPKKLINNIEKALRRNINYDLCRNLNQLNGVRLFQITDDANARYISHMMKRGIKAGDIKPVKLSPHTGWTEVFNGRYY